MDNNYKMNRITNVPTKKLPFFLGRLDDWEDVVIDLNSVYHLLITGYTGAGKSTLLHNALYNLISHSNPKNVKIILLDPTSIEFSCYSEIPHLLIPPITDTAKIDGALKWCIMELADRITKLSETGVHSLDDYNAHCKHFKLATVPDIIIIYDGYSASSETNNTLRQILLNGKNVGMHLILSTQETTKIKSIFELFPGYACFKSSANLLSSVITKKLFLSLGIGEFYYKELFGNNILKLQVPDISFQDLTYHLHDLDIKRFTQSDSVADNPPAWNLLTSKSDVSLKQDELFQQAAKFIVTKEKASIGMIQRMFKVGFNRASRIIEQLADAGIVGPEEGTKPRKVLLSEKQLEIFLKNL